MTSSLEFDPSKYLLIAKQRGVDEALTVLHHDIVRWEHEAFEGSSGYQPAMIEALEAVREFSRQLWEMATEPSTDTGKQG